MTNLKDKLSASVRMAKAPAKQPAPKAKEPQQSGSALFPTRVWPD